MKLVEFFNKSYPYYTFVLLLGGILVYAIPLFYNTSISPTWFSLNADQKIDDELEENYPNYFPILEFVNNTVQPNSNVLFMDINEFVLGQPYLFPRLNVFYCNYTNDQAVSSFIIAHRVNYVLIDYFNFTLAQNTTLFFDQINMNTEVYLLQVNESLYH